MNEKTGDFVQKSITLPRDIEEKLLIIQSSLSAPKNTSALISKILRASFKNDVLMKETIEFDDNTMLVSVQLYKEVEGISQMLVNSRIKKRKIRVEKIGNKDFVVVDEFSIKNIYLQAAQQQQIIKDFGIQLMKMHDKFEEYEKILNEIRSGTTD